MHIQIHSAIPLEVDLYLIILKMSEEKLDFLPAESIKKASLVLFNMIGFVNLTLARKFSVIQRKSLSVRDVLNVIEFMQVAYPLFKESREYQLATVLFNAVSLVIMDGLCLGIDVAGNK
jgi:midasin (ATPase involved in ribosome maturation)